MLKVPYPSAIAPCPGLASWGGCAKLLAAPRTPEEHLGHPWQRIMLLASCAKVADFAAFGHPGSGRQMNHYFNMDEWQDKMNARQGPRKKAKTGW